MTTTIVNLSFIINKRKNLINIFLPKNKQKIIIAKLYAIITDIYINSWYYNISFHFHLKLLRSINIIKSLSYHFLALPSVPYVGFICSSNSTRISPFGQ